MQATEGVSWWRRSRRTLLVALAVPALALGVNAYVTDRETKQARADVGQLVEVDGQELQIREDGPANRPPLVLIHGLAGSIRQWDSLVPRLARRYRVIRIDLLGHGGSDKPREGYAPEAQARRIGGLLDKRRIRRVLVVGHSLGGMIAVALAERRPHLVRGLVTIGTPARSGDVDLPATAQMGTLPVAGELLHRVVSDGMVEAALEDSLGSGADVPRQFVDDYRDMTFSAYRGSYREANRFAEESSLDKRLSATKVPLLAVMGAEDKEVKARALDTWAEVPGATVTRLPGRGHAPQWQDPAQIASLITAFEHRVPA
jgi:pimeloyl-ACP methyl ester carboxylesterase